MRNRQALDFYGDMPEDMRRYLRYNGFHFNKKLCEMAVSQMRKKNPATGRPEPIEPIKKEEVDEMLKRYGITLENAAGYDHVYVANMIKADFYGTSISDETHHAIMVKDFIDDEDQADGYLMHRWYADQIRSGMPVEWSEAL